MELNGTDKYLIEKAIKDRIQTINNLLPFRDEKLNKSYEKQREDYINLIAKINPNE